MIVFLIYFIFSSQDILDSSFKKIYLESDDSNCNLDQYLRQNQNSLTPVCFIRCTFQSILNQDDGGAISIQLKRNIDDNIYFENCTFSYCTANKGGAIYLKYEKECHTTIINSIFLNNEASSLDGGSIYIISEVQHTNFILINCTIHSMKNGNAVLIQNLNNYSIYDCTFNENFLDIDAFNDERSGAAFRSINSIGTFENCIFSNNYEKNILNNNYGGAVFFSKSTFSIKNTTFSYNSIKYCLKILGGGAICISESTYFFEKCNFLNNYLMVTASNPKSMKGAAIYSTKSSGFFLDTIFSYNKINGKQNDSFGGAIYLKDINVSLKNCSFVNNQASTPSFNSLGGAIYLESNEVLIENCTFDSNTATSHGISSGGSIYLKSDKVAILDTFFIQNKAVSSSQNSFGGAILIGIASGKFNNCTFINNIAEKSLLSFSSSDEEPCSKGGAISLSYSNLEFIDCLFRNNSGFGNSSSYDSTSKGGAIYASFSNIKIFNCHFLNNTLFNLGNRFEIEYETNGGACHFYYTNASISDTEFFSNTATLIPSSESKYFAGKIFGGAVCHQGEKSTLRCQYCTFTNNSISVMNHQELEFGGSLVLTNGVIEHCTFSDNIGCNGCDIHFDHKLNSQIVIEKCYFKHSSFFNHTIKSIIHIYGEKNNLKNVFSSNSVVLNISTPLLDGSLQNQEGENNKIDINFVFEKNCISPYNEEIYKTDEIEILDQNGTEKVHFMSAFEEPCDEYVKPETRPFPTQSKYIPTQTKYVPTQTKYIPTQSIKVETPTQQISTQTEQVNTQTEQVNTQTQTEQVKTPTQQVSTQTEQIETQTQTEQVNTQTQQIPTQTSQSKTATDEIAIITKPFTPTNDQDEESEEDKIPYKKIIFILLIIVGVLIILAIIAFTMICVLIRRRKKEVETTLTSQLLDMYNM